MDYTEPSQDIDHQQRQGIRVSRKAPIAARLEDCLLALSRLCAGICLDRPESDDVVTANDLDHALRRSPPLHGATLNLLIELSETLQEANEELTPRSMEPQIETTNVNENLTSGSEEVGMNDDQLREFEVSQHLEVSVEIVSLLRDLLPNLLDPAPEDTYNGTLSTDDVEMDIKRTRSLFPAASFLLCERLGRVNCRRRQIIREEKRLARCPGNDQMANIGYTVPTHEESGRIGNCSVEDNQTKTLRRNLSYVSENGASVAPSIAETVFSKAPTSTYGPSATSMAESLTHGPFEIRSLPPLPVPLIPQSKFICPYCRFEIVVGDQDTAMQDWHDHIWLDLEPYICTFNDCIRADKTFASRDEWFRHELECHRVRKTWSCRSLSCKREFGTRESFEAHLRAEHEEICNPNLCGLIIDNCKGYSQKPLGRQSCPLCGTPLLDAKTSMLHIGTHLEQLALTCIYEHYSEKQPSYGGVGASSEVSAITESRSHDPKHLDESLGQPRKTLTNPWLNETEDIFSTAIRPQRLNSPKSEHGQLHDASQTIATNLWVTTQSSETVIRSNAPPRNLLFVGRKDYLQSMRSCLSSPGQICVLSGDGGIGKTTTAIEFTYLFGDDYSYVFWVDAETTGSCADTYSLISPTLIEGSDELHDQDNVNSLVTEALERTKGRWLLILDNVERWSNVERYVPRKIQDTQGSVLITIQKGKLLEESPRRDKCQVLPMGPMSLDESRELLLRSLDSDFDRSMTHWSLNHDYAGDVSMLAEGLPLAISMIAGYLQEEPDCSLPVFLEIWNEKRSRSTGITQNLGPGSVGSCIDILWDIGIRELPMQARDLLHILIFLDPEAIQKNLLVGDHKEPALEFLNSAETHRYVSAADLAYIGLIVVVHRYKGMVKKLSGRRLVNIKDKDEMQTLSIHRLLQNKIRLALTSEEFVTVFDRAYCLVRKKYPPASPIQAPERHKWPDCKKYVPHVLSLWNAFVNSGHLVKPTLNLAQLFYDAGFHAWERQVNLADGIGYLKTAERMLNNLNIGKDSKLRADINCILAMSFASHGPRRDADIMDRRAEALRIRKMIHAANPSDRESDILLTNSSNDLGLSLLGTFGFEEAGKIFETCYKRYRCWGSEDEFPFEYGKYYMNTARVRTWQGNYQDAIKLGRRGVELFEKAVGDTWNALLSQFVLAYILLQSGDLQAALDLHLQVFTARKKICGKYDFTTVLSSYAVGAAYYHLGDLSAAASHLRDCIVRASRSANPEDGTLRQIAARARLHLCRIYNEVKVYHEEAEVLDRTGREMLKDELRNLPPYITGVEDEMVILDELQTEIARYTGRSFLPHMQKWCSTNKERELTVGCSVKTGLD
ncbi:hypothetical protein DL98DRAFT_648173 [Cadophora sp. DSE1049]|nr:hypothetical protein DL98DRAFT_648173 [Cadophora sp. DSE1049]